MFDERCRSKARGPMLRVVYPPQHVDSVPLVMRSLPSGCADATFPLNAVAKYRPQGQGLRNPREGGRSLLPSIQPARPPGRCAPAIRGAAAVPKRRGSVAQEVPGEFRVLARSWPPPWRRDDSSVGIRCGDWERGAPMRAIPIVATAAVPACKTFHLSFDAASRPLS